MKIGIMQPYFFPYIGYFQLIHAVDTYVNLDHVSFMKRSYMTRNTLKNGTDINIPVSGGSQNKTCTEVNVLADDKWFNSFEKTLETLYKKSSHYDDVMNNVYNPWRDHIKIRMDNPISISYFNISSIYYICWYLDCLRPFHSSVGITDRKKNEGLQDIAKYHKADTYINAIGGQKLYTKEDFATQGIDLNFIKMGELELVNPYASILDLLFTYDKEHLKQQLTNYTLI